LRKASPDVHEVIVEERLIELRSAGPSLFWAITNLADQTSAILLERETAAGEDAPPVCLAPWLENPYRLVSLRDMLEFAAGNFCRASGNIGQLFAQIKSDVLPMQGSWNIIAGELGMLERDCEALELTNTLAQIRRLKPAFLDGSQNVVYRDFARDIMEVHARMIDELASRKLFCLLQERTRYYVTPRAGWEGNCALPGNRDRC
jgi:hypothetical protein